MTKKPATKIGNTTAKKQKSGKRIAKSAAYDRVLTDMVGLLDNARRMAARTVNAVMTATYWEIGRRIVEEEQGGKRRAGYGDALLAQLAEDLTKRLGRGFSNRSLRKMRQFYILRPAEEIWPTLSAKSVKALQSGVISGEDRLEALAGAFPLPWSAYVELLRVDNANARVFYEKEALTGGWSVRQLQRQVRTQFYERTMVSKNKAAMLTRGSKAKPEDTILPEEQVRDPYVLEFLDLKDEYSENDLEDALVRHLESFLLELGGDFAFIGRQKRLRIEDQWYRVDLVFYHRRLSALVLIDLKLDHLTAGDLGQMHVYCRHAAEQWALPHENPPVGLILCAKTNATLARYALDLPNKILAAEYQTALPEPELLESELRRTRRALEGRQSHDSDDG